MAAPTLMVHKFWTEYKQDPNDPGKLIGVDKVQYGPINGATRSIITAKVSDLSRLQPLEGSQNPAVVMAHERWAVIQRHYEAWKKGQEAPLEGTPLSAWNALNQEQADLFRSRGIKTVEAFAAMTDSVMSQVQVPNLRDLVRQAKNFIDASEQTRLASKLAEKDNQIDALRSEADEQKAQIADLLKKVDALAELAAAKVSEEPKRGPGRPRKNADEAVAA